MNARVPSADEGAGAPPATDHDRALELHRQRLRRPRLVYAAVVSAVVVALVVIAAVAYAHGEISHVTLHTVAAGPSAVELQTPDPAPARAWESTDHAAVGSPVWQGTVVTYDDHTVRGRNVLTGRPTWSYERSDRRVCAAVQTQGVTIAVYRIGPGCDELTGLDSGTGARLWTRTLYKDGAVFDGPTTYSVTDGNVLFVSPTSVYAISPSGADDPNGGLDYWVFHHPGCTITGAALGSTGALISQTCRHQDCAGLRFCADGPQLLLRNATTSADPTARPKNPDAITWLQRDTDLRALSGGVPLVAVTHGTGAGTVRLLSPTTGATTGSFAVTDGDSATALDLSTGVLVSTASATYSVGLAATGPQWEAPTTGPVSTVSPDGSTNQILTAATATGAVQLDLATGHAARSIDLGPPAPGSSVIPVGSGVLVAGPSSTGYWR